MGGSLQISHRFQHIFCAEIHVKYDPWEHDHKLLFTRCSVGKQPPYFCSCLHARNTFESFSCQLMALYIPLFGGLYGHNFKDIYPVIVLKTSFIYVWSFQHITKHQRYINDTTDPIGTVLCFCLVKKQY